MLLGFLKKIKGCFKSNLYVLCVLFYSIVINLFPAQHFDRVLAILKCFINKLGLG